MKLHFYCLNYINGIQYTECEVRETAKLYYPISHFPNNYFMTYVRKSDIGKLKYEEWLILSERNDSIAREVFSKCITEVINAREKMLNKFKKTLEKVNSFGIENK